MTENLNLTQGKVLPTLLKFTVPVMLTLLLQIAYGMVDLLIVGQFAQISDVSAVTIGSQIMSTITSLFTGLSMGTTILLGQYIGANKADKTSRVVGVSVAFFSMLAIVTTVLIVLLNETMAMALKTPLEALPQTKQYLFICSIGTLFIVAYNLIGSIFRGIGDSKTPLITVAIACVINIILDLVFVAGFNMGAAGAALATVIAQASSVVLSLLLMRNKQLPFKLSRKDIVFEKSYIAGILKLGIPIALQSVLVNISFLAITAIINTFGVVASAAVGIVEKITGIIMIVPMAFMQSLSVFTAQNFGAGEMKRTKQGLLYSMGVSLVFGVVMAYLAFFHGTLFTRFFTTDEVVTGQALLYLKSYAFDTILVCVMFAFSGYFNGCGKTNFVMIQAVSGAFLIRIPFAYLFSTLADTSLFVIGLATPLSTAMQIVLCIGYYMYYQKKLSSQVDQNNESSLY